MEGITASDEIPVTDDPTRKDGSNHGDAAFMTTAVTMGAPGVNGCPMIGGGHTAARITGRDGDMWRPGT